MCVGAEEGSDGWDTEKKGGKYLGQDKGVDEKALTG